jgi:hypothetical protein
MRKVGIGFMKKVRKRSTLLTWMREGILQAQSPFLKIQPFRLSNRHNSLNV